MIIIHSPEGGESQRFDAGRLRASEIQVIERTADGRWADIRAAARDGDINALRVIAWVIKKRTEPALRYADFDPYEDELRARLDEREVRAYAEAILEEYRTNPDDLAEAFAELHEAAADPEKVDAVIAEVTAPKDPAPAEAQPSPASPSDG
ncbi:hypothetical protein AB0N92_04240 [Streptomyces sp. NPDC093248]|uniref:hypothetical protein n=1 Tax=Streptomyces sp. NPDC093248 TaxID=3155072 RepID=UPI00343B9C3F